MRRLGKNSKAKKYANLRQLQATANRYLKDAKQAIGKDNTKYKNVMTRLRTFYKTRGLKWRGYASMYDLTREDLKSYEQLLKSVTENSYINPKKRAEMEEKQHRTYIEEGGREEDYEQYRENFKTIQDSDVLQMLVQIGFRPSELNDYMMEYDTEGLDSEDFEYLCSDFLKAYESGNYTQRDFLNYVEKWAVVAENLRDIDNGSLDSVNDYIEKMDTNGLTENDFLKIAKEYEDNNEGYTFMQFFDNWVKVQNEGSGTE